MKPVEVMQHFDKYARRYGRRTEERFKDVVNFLRETLGKNSKILVLDIGCGQGEFLSHIRAILNYTCVGIDISEKMLSMRTRASKSYPGGCAASSFQAGFL